MPQNIFDMPKALLQRNDGNPKLTTIPDKAYNLFPRISIPVGNERVLPKGIRTFPFDKQRIDPMLTKLRSKLPQSRHLHDLDTKVQMEPPNRKPIARPGPKGQNQKCKNKISSHKL
jgi:hypothetical protein